MFSMRFKHFSALMRSIQFLFVFFLVFSCFFLLLLFHVSFPQCITFFTSTFCRSRPGEPEIAMVRVLGLFRVTLAVRAITVSRALP